MLSPSIDQVLATVVVALLYLVGLRIIDINEREPVWSLLLAFVLGGAAAGALNLGIDPVALNLDPWRGAMLRDVALFVGLGIFFGIVTAIGRWRGWCEVNDVVDGLIYGAAAGLGFTCGEQIANLGSVPFTLVPSSPLVTLGTTALAGLAQGVFGALIGAGFAVASLRRSLAWRAWPVIGLLAAIVSHGAYDVLAYGNALGGEAALLRARLALALPLAGVIAMTIYGLVVERHAIAEELRDEITDPLTNAADADLLLHIGRRHRRYARALLTSRLTEFTALSNLHKRQVMLALAKRRARLARSPLERDAANAEARRLREHVAVAGRWLNIVTLNAARDRQ